MIFFLAGLMMGVQLFSIETKITGEDWGKMIAFYILGRLSRFIMVFGLAWFFNKGNYKLKLKEFFFIAFGGLRGSIGISLAVAFRNIPYFTAGGPRERAGELVLFFSSGHVFFNFLIDATIMPIVMKKLGIVKVNPARDGMLKSIIHDLNKETAKNLENAKSSSTNMLCNWEGINGMLGLDED